MHNQMTPDTKEAVTHTEIERTLIRIWSDVLNIECATIHEGFLGMGGDSLAAMRCINRISSSFGVELPIDLFLLDSADIARVASVIASMQIDQGQG